MTSDKNKPFNLSTPQVKFCAYMWSTPCRKTQKWAWSSQDMIFLKDSIAQINYIGMEYSIGSNFIQDMEFFKYQIFEELHRALFFSLHGVLHKARFIKAYGVLKIINFIKPSIMQFSYFYNGALHETIFINDYGVLRLIIVNQLHVVLFMQMYGVLHGAILTKRRGALRIVSLRRTPQSKIYQSLWSS